MKILLSIKPEYAERILDGSKRYEFRKRIHRDSRVNTVVIYATMPVGKVIGEFSIKDVHEHPPKKLWSLTKNHSGISESFFEEYFKDRDVGYAIEVRSVRKYKSPKHIQEFLPSGIAPQSYAYIS